MKKIKLTRGMYAKVDNEDYERLSKRKWSALQSGLTNYAVHSNKVNGKKTVTYMHREVIGAETDHRVDHINHDGLDNQRKNLRFVDSRQNNQNRRNLPKSGYVGAYKSKIAKKRPWKSAIDIDGKPVHLGYYRTAELAHAAYLGACSLIGTKYAGKNKL